MGTITSGIGLASGIDTGSIIEQLTQLERRPINTLQSRIAQTSQVQLVFAELTTRLNQLKSAGTELRKPSTFDQTNASSSDESAIVASAGVATPAGSYTFRTARLVSTQQLVTSGFATAEDTPVGAGTISVELGNGRLDQEPLLEDLRGGEGVRRGVIEIVDKAGRFGRVDVSDAVSLDDVVNRLNAAPGVSVTAEVEDGALILRDLSGGAGDLRIRDVTGHAAEDLGIAQTTAATSVTGGNLSGLSRQTSLSSLNDGRGVSTGPMDGLSVTLRDGTTFDVDLSLASSVGDVIDRFNDAAAGSATLSVSGSGLRIDDATAGASTVVTGRGGTSNSAAELGLVASEAGGVVQGSDLVARPGSVLLSSLIGGNGLVPGTISVTNGAGASTNIDLSGAVDVAGLIDRINDSGANVTARLNDAGNGIDLVDTSGGTGPLVVADASGTTAADLGWAGSHDDGDIAGSNLQRAWMTGRSILSDLNAGRGISLGEVKVTDGDGNTATFNFKAGIFDTVDDVLERFNEAGTGVNITARINANGDGIEIVDNTGGAAPLQIEAMSGGTATDLRIAGEHAGGSANGSFEVSVDVSATDSLDDVRRKLNELDLPLRADILDTGSGQTPFRLSVSGRESGRLGGFVFDARLGGDGRALETSSMSRARDSALFVGDGTGGSLLVTSGSNTIKDVVPGLTLDLKRANSGPVTVSVEEDLDSAVEEVQGMVEAFNALRDTIDDNSDYNEELDRRGVLLGEPSVQKVENAVYKAVSQVYDSGNPEYRILRDIGIKVADGAKLELDEDKFRAAWADDAAAVKAMFTQSIDGEDGPEGVGFGHIIQKSIELLTDPADGLLTNVTKTLEQKTADFEEQILRIEDSVAAKRTRLEKQFLDMELALSRLQFQSEQIANIPKFNYSVSRGNNSN